MFRPQRQHRKEKLEQDGFLPYEATSLSRNKILSPSMRKLRNERRALYQNYTRECRIHKIKPSVKGWKGVVGDLYKQMDWLDNSGKLNPFARLKEISDQLTSDEREHGYPDKKKKPRISNTSTFQQTLKRTREKQLKKELAPRLARAKGIK